MGSIPTVSTDIARLSRAIVVLAGTTRTVIEPDQVAECLAATALAGAAMTEVRPMLQFVAASPAATLDERP